MKRLLLLALVASLITIVSPAYATDRYSCVVENFIGFDISDTAFIAKNKRKTFDLAVGEDMVDVSMHSKDFTPSENRYNLARRTFLDTILFREDRLGEETLVMPNNPKSNIARDGFFNATISLQSSFYNNAWLLRCVS